MVLALLIHLKPFAIQTRDNRESEINMSLFQGTVSGVVHSVAAGLSPSKQPYARLLLRHDTVKRGVSVTHWITVHLAKHLFADEAAARALVARYAVGRKVVALGRMEIGVWAKGPVNAPDLSTLQEQVSLDVLVFSATTPELF